MDVYLSSDAVPFWALVEKEIPFAFTDNGFSTPIPLRLFRGPLSIIATRYSPIEARVGRVHDWLFWYGRLPGAPLGTERLTMVEANKVAEDMLRWFGYEKTAHVVCKALDRFGQSSWDNASRTMLRHGDIDYPTYLARITKARPVIV